MKLFFYSLRELINNKSFCLLFILNLSFGLTGFIALDGFKNSVDKTIKSRSKSALGADFGVSSRQVFVEEELQKVKSFFKGPFEETHLIEMTSMVANKDLRSRLVQLKAVDANYPFYGEIELESGRFVNKDNFQKIKNQQKIWIYPELKRQLSIDVGDLLTIGEVQFEVDDIIKVDPSNGLSTSMAPRIYMSREGIEKTNLLRKGSIAWHSRTFKLAGTNSEELAELRDKVFKDLDRPGIQVYTHENVSAQMSTMMARLNDFLGLTSLVALFLAAVGTFFLFRSFVKNRSAQVATLMSLGLSRWGAFLYYLGQVLILGFVSSLLAILFSFIIVPGLGFVTQELLPFNIVFSLNPSSLVLGVLIGTIGSLSICLPILVSLKNIKVKNLLSQGALAQSSLDVLTVMSYLPSLVTFVALSIWLANSYQVGSLFSSMFLASAGVLSLVSWILFYNLNRFKIVKNLSLGWALRDLARKKTATLMAFMAIGLGALLLNLIPQIKASLSAELERPEQSKLPSLFMFDIQEEQLPEFEKVLKEEEVSVSQISPTIRARLISVNDQEFDKGKGNAESFSREEEREMRFRNRGFNLSYRKKLSESERIIEGKPFSGSFNPDKDEVAEISIEKRFAKRLGFKMGDILKFEIESIPVVGKIINVREVKWTSFQPNFFVQFQEGVLEMAPKTYIATTPSLTLDKKYQVQDRLVQQLPNISMVDVSRIVKRINEIIEQMSWALTFMSLLCLLSGFVVLFSIASHQARARKWEVGLLKTLGASFQTIERQFLWQFCLISFFAISFGIFLSLLASYFVSSLLFDSLWIFDWKTPLLSLILGSLLTYWVTSLAIKKALKTPGRELFN